jgi:hypothetical protein
MKNAKLFPLPPGCDIRAVVIRALTGEDELEARAKQSLNDEELGLRIFDEQVRLSIAAVQRHHDARPMPVRGRVDDFDTWCPRTRRFLVEGFQQVNGVRPEEIAAFRASGESWTPTAEDAGAEVVG